jgi:hypothetical protein
MVIRLGARRDAAEVLKVPSSTATPKGRQLTGSCTFVRIAELNFTANNIREARAHRKLRREHIEKQYLLHKIEFNLPIRTTPTVVNSVLYVATENTLYAIG